LFAQCTRSELVLISLYPQSARAIFVQLLTLRSSPEDRAAFPPRLAVRIIHRSVEQRARHNDNCATAILAVRRQNNVVVPYELLHPRTSFKERECVRMCRCRSRSCMHCPQSPPLYNSIQCPPYSFPAIDASHASARSMARNESERHGLASVRVASTGGETLPLGKLCDAIGLLGRVR